MYTHTICTAAAVGACLAVAPGAHAAGAVFGGQTKAGEAIVLNSDRAAQRLRSAVIGVPADCTDGSTFFTAKRVVASASSAGRDDLLMTRNAKGRFTGAVVSDVDLGDSVAVSVVKLAGKLAAKRASGTVRFDVEIMDKQTQATTGECHSGTIRWSATHAPGRVYGGITSQGEPMVVRVNASRKTVTDLITAWETESCSPDGALRFPEHLDTFPVRAGRFGDTWHNPVTTAQGNQVDYAYDVAGKLSRSSITGTLRVGIDETTADGAPLLSCDTNRVSWKAVTG